MKAHILTWILLGSLAFVAFNVAGAKQVQAPECANSGKTAGANAAQSIGTATMTDSGVLIYHIKGAAIGQPSMAVVVWKYPRGSVGFPGAVKWIGGIKPGQHKPIPPYVQSAGSVSMDKDHVLTILLYRNPDKGVYGEGMIKMKPGDKGYKRLLERLCGLKPGQVKPLPTG